MTAKKHQEKDWNWYICIVVAENNENYKVGDKVLVFIQQMFIEHLLIARK